MVSATMISAERGAIGIFQFPDVWATPPSEDPTLFHSDGMNWGLSNLDVIRSAATGVLDSATRAIQRTKNTYRAISSLVTGNVNLSGLTRSDRDLVEKFIGPQPSALEGARRRLVTKLEPVIAFAQHANAMATDPFYHDTHTWFGKDRPSRLEDAQKQLTQEYFNSFPAWAKGQRRSPAISQPRFSPPPAVAFAYALPQPVEKRHTIANPYIRYALAAAQIRHERPPWLTTALAEYAMPPAPEPPVFFPSDVQHTYPNLTIQAVDGATHAFKVNVGRESQDPKDPKDAYAMYVTLENDQVRITMVDEGKTVSDLSQITWARGKEPVEMIQGASRMLSEEDKETIREGLTVVLGRLIDNEFPAFPPHDIRARRIVEERASAILDISHILGIVPASKYLSPPKA